jgi:dihydroorotate dehydrogenase
VTAEAHEVATTLLGVPLASPLMNAPGTIESVRDVEAFVAARPGALCLRPVTVQPFVHPEFRSLRNPGHDRLLPLVRQLVALGSVPVVACIAGSTAEELGFLARVFGDAGAALVQLHLAEPWVAATLAPFQDLATFVHVCATVREHATTPLLCDVPSEARAHYADVGRALRETGVGGAVVRGDFTGLEKFVLEAGRDDLELVALGDVDSGWTARRVLDKGARAIQLDRPLRTEGPAAVRRITAELRTARR